MKNKLITIDPAALRIGREAPFRYRRFLPGEEAPGAGPPVDDGSLVESVGRCGLLHPPLLLEESGEGLTVVCGHRRIAAAHVAGIRSINAISLEASREEVIPLWLEDARFGVPLSDLELIMLISRCRSLSGERFGGVEDRLSGVAGRNLSASYMERVERLLELPDDILEALHEGRLSTGDLMTLSEDRAIDSEWAARLLAGAKLKRAERREAVRLLLRIGDVGNMSDLEETLHKQEGGLMDTLRAACNPSLERDQERIGEIIDRMRLPPGASLHPPENLEGGDYRLAARIRDERGLEELLGKLRSALERGDIGRLLDILKGRY